MSQENVDILRKVNALANAGDWNAVFDLYHPDIEFRDLRPAPDVPEVLRGTEAIRRVVAGWVETYDEFRTEVLEYVDADPWVICDTRWYGKGKGSGIKSRTARSSARSSSPDVARALKAVGLSE